MPNTNWMIVTSPDNYERTRALRFTVQGIKSRHRRKAERMAPGDRVCWYLTGIQAFAATATITSPYFEGTERIWVSGEQTERGAASPRRANPPALSSSRGTAARLSETGDNYPWRFKIEKDHALDPDRAVRATTLIAKLRFIRRWPKEHWRLAFQGNVHELDDRDFALIEDAVVAAERTRRVA